MQTTLQAMNSGVATGSPAIVNYYFDPQVEFLELGRMVDNPANSPAAARTWKVYGPDKSGVYGGAQGEGGLENEVDEQQSFASQPFTNYFGDEVGAFYSPSVGAGYAYSPYSYGVTMGGYGYEPGSPEFLSTPVETPAWRGRYADDYTGFICFGARYYEYHSGRWLSADPLGNGSSMSLYDYCNGDPVNGMDPDGRCIEGFESGENGTVSANAPNSAAFAFGSEVGSLLSGAGRGAQNGAGGEVDTLSLGNIQGAFGSDTNSFEYGEGQVAGGVAGVSLAAAGGVAAAPFVVDALGSGGLTASIYNGATAFTSSGVVLGLAGTGVGVAEEQPIEEELEAVAPEIEQVAAEEGTTLARTLGQAGEDAAGIVKNTQRIPSLSGTASYRIPDELSDTVLGEVKNVGNLSYTSQLRDFNMFSQQNGLLFQLTVRPTTTLSPALQAEVANGNIVLKFLPEQ